MKNRQRLIVLLQSPDKRTEWRKRGKASVPGGHNACAATASQPYCFDLHVLAHINRLAEGLVKDLKKTKQLMGGSINDVEEGDLIVCIDDPNDADQNSEHVWHVVRVLGDGWYECFDNQSGRGDKIITSTTYRRRLDGKDGKTRARGRLRLIT